MYVILGLLLFGSWQDLKDYMREVGDVCYIDVYKDGIGVVEFFRKEDMKYVVSKLDDIKFRFYEVCIWFSEWFQKFISIILINLDVFNFVLYFNYLREKCFIFV